MADINNLEEITPQAVEHVSVPAKRQRSFFVFLALMLSIVAVGMSGYLYYCGTVLKHRTDTSLNELNTRYALLMFKQDEQTIQMHKEITDLTTRVNNLSPKQNLIYQINEFINLANQLLLIYHDNNTAIRLLNYAEDALGANTDAIFTELKLAISTDVAKLTQLPIIDTVQLSGELDGLAASIDKLSLGYNDTAIKVAPVEGSKWQKFVHNVTHSLLGLVSITQVDAPMVLTPNTEIFIKESLKFDLLNAKMALLNRDEGAWKYSLQDAQSNLNKYFIAYVGVGQINTQLTQLLEVHLDAHDANIDATLHALQKINTLRN